MIFYIILSHNFNYVFFEIERDRNTRWDIFKNFVKMISHSFTRFNYKFLEIKRDRNKKIRFFFSTRFNYKFLEMSDRNAKLLKLLQFHKKTTIFYIILSHIRFNYEFFEIERDRNIRKKMIRVLFMAHILIINFSKSIKIF